MYKVYILYSENYDRYHIGQTDSIEARLKRHNDGEVKSTKSYRPWILKYTEELKTRSEAMKREKFLKKQKNKEFYRKLVEISIGRVPSTRD